MREPEVFLAYAPRGPGLRCALAYLKDGRDVYGWFTGLCDDGSLASRYFLLEGFYANAPTRYEEAAELHSGWGLAEGRRHELARTQEAFAHEWLAYDDAAEARAYDESELAVSKVNVRHARLAKFSKLQPNWTWYSPGFERPVLNALAKRWTLDYEAGGD
jgi:hypothetical protein